MSDENKFECPENRGNKLIIEKLDSTVFFRTLGPWTNGSREEFCVVIEGEELKRLKSLVQSL
jgi:hypothetical protein